MRSIYLLLFFVPSFIWANIQVDIGLTVKKGVDKGLTLSSELHQRIKLESGERIYLKMDNAEALLIEVLFYQNEMDYGPSALVKVLGEVRDKNEKTIFEFGEKNIQIIPLGEEKNISFAPSKDKLIEIKIKPVMD